MSSFKTQSYPYSRILWFQIWGRKWPSKKKKKRCCCCARFPIEIKTRYYRCRIQIYAPLKCSSWKERSLQLGANLTSMEIRKRRFALPWIRFSFNANRLYRDISLSFVPGRVRVVGIRLWTILSFGFWKYLRINYIERSKF